MRKLVVLVISIGVLVVGVVATAALADPGLNDHPVPHRHYINGVEVGPRICDEPGNPGVQEAFNQFHANHHNHNGTGGQGPIAPGINNDKGGELTFSGC